MAAFNYGTYFAPWQRYSVVEIIVVVDPIQETTPARVFSEYELAVIGFFERFGYVSTSDRYIIEDYQSQVTPDVDREDTRELEREPSTPFDEPEFVGPAEYPFQDFNYGP